MERTYAIALMVEEHKYIKRMLAVIRRLCYKVLQHDKVDYSDFFKAIDFIRNYADKHHHGKEEALLFEKMVEELGPTAEKLVKLGMYVEHDQGRLYTQELEAAVKRVMEGDDEARLDVIANAISYTHLLNRHIDKEDGVVYVYAQKNLGSDTLNQLDQATLSLEEEAKAANIQQRYIALLEQMEMKY